MIDKILIYFHINPAPFPYGYYKKSPYQMTLHSEYHNIKGDLFYSFRHQTYTDWSEESYFEILLNRIRYEISSIISPEVALKIRGDVVHVDWFMHSVLKGYINFIRSTTTGWWPEVGYERDVSQLNYGRLSWVGNVICFPFYHELLYSYCNKFNPSCSEIVRDCPPLLSLIAKLDNIFDPNIFKKENVTVGDIVNLSVFMFISILLALISQIVLYLLVIIVTVVIIRVLKIFDFFGWTPFKAYNPEDWDEYFLFNSLLASKILYIFVLIPYIFLDSFLIFIYILYHSFITFFYSWTIYIDAIHSLIFYMESISSWEKLEILLKLNEKSPLFITYTLIGFIISGALILITWFLHISQESKSFDRAAPYECGFEIFNDIKNTSIHVQWFIVANLFLIFELEILTMLPFFLAISEMSFISYVWFSIFFIILGIGFIYEWNKKSIDFV
jgi:NADH:ubiquinone oxidoreductase subunit 3 (subunit A)